MALKSTVALARGPSQDRLAKTGLRGGSRWLSTRPMERTTLAGKLGMTIHLSPLLRKARSLGLSSQGLRQLAIQRGCSYYEEGGTPLGHDPGRDVLPDDELAMALLNPSLDYDPQNLRVGAAMLGAPGNTPARLARLATLERCEAVVRHVAEAGRSFEPTSQFWPQLLSLLPASPPPKPGVLPHPTRFVAMTGITRRGVETVAQWIRPGASAPGHG